MSGIVVDTNLTFLQRKLGISPEKFYEKYVDKSVTEIIKEEAEDGNELAVKLAYEMTNNVDFVKELFSLVDIGNRFEILKEMNEDQLMLFLEVMEKEDLQEGLKYFKQEKLLDLYGQLDPEFLVKVVLAQFSKEEVVKLIPEDELDKILTSTDVEKEDILKQMKSIPAVFLAQMIESITGEEVEEQDPNELIKQIANFSDLEFKQGLLNLKDEPKQLLVLGLSKEKEEYLQLVNPKAYVDMMGMYREKEDNIQAAKVLKQEHLVNIVKELPKELVASVILMLNVEEFAKTMMKKTPEIMAKIILGEG